MTMSTAAATSDAEHVDERRGLPAAGVATDDLAEQPRDDEALGDKDEPRGDGETGVVLVGRRARRRRRRARLPGGRATETIARRSSPPEREHRADEHRARCRGRAPRRSRGRSSRDESGRRRRARRARILPRAARGRERAGASPCETSSRAMATAIAEVLAPRTTRPINDRYGAGRRGDAPREEEVRREREQEAEPHRLTEGDERELGSGVLEHHRLVDHRQLEVGRGIVDGDPARLGDDRRSRVRRGRVGARGSPPSRVGERRGDDRGQVRGPSLDRERENRDEEGGLGERADRHRPARPHAAERGARVEAGERECDGAREQEVDDDEQVGALSRAPGWS